MLIELLLIGLMVGLVAVLAVKIIAAARAARAQDANTLDRARGHGDERKRATDATASGLLTAEADRFIRSRQAAWRLRC